MMMCHCWADTREELFEMMTTIGVQHKWFQRPDQPDAPPGMKASWEHFDIAKSKRALAIKNGAVATDRYGCIEHEAWQRVKSDNPKLRVQGGRQLLRLFTIRQRKGEPTITLEMIL